MRTNDDTVTRLLIPFITALILGASLGCASIAPPASNHFRGTAAPPETFTWRVIESRTSTAPELAFDSASVQSSKLHGKAVQVAWFRISYPTNQFDMRTQHDYRSSRNQYAVNCEQHTLEVVRSTEYDSNGDVVAQGGRDATIRAAADPYGEKANGTVAPPDARVQDGIFSAVCSSARGTS